VAVQDIESSQALIRVHCNALLTAPNAVDRDPVLSQFLGKQARRQHGWNYNDNDDEDKEQSDDVDLDAVQRCYELFLPLHCHIISHWGKRHLSCLMCNCCSRVQLTACPTCGTSKVHKQNK
jgi:hypothetical protein